MKDRIVLIGCAVAMAVLAWGLWRVFQFDTPALLLTMTAVGLAAENHRLRRELRIARRGSAAQALG